MRLGTCLLVELVVGAGLAAGVGVSGAWGVEQLRHRWHGMPAVAAAAPTVIAPITSLDHDYELAPSDRALPLFAGVHDEVLLAPLRTAAVTRVKFNHGGTSISLRLDFENGARAAFKPQQTNWQTIPRREVAAYRINRLLGLGSVAPAFGRKFSRSDLLEHLDADQAWMAPRLLAETITDDTGDVVGELSWWIPVIDSATVDGFHIDSVDGIVTWKRYLTARYPIPDQELGMVTQISNMVLFDYLINNSDRWSGGNAKMSEDGRLLYYMDNTLSFGVSDDGQVRTRTYLRRVQKFSRYLVHRLRTLTVQQLRDALSDSGPFESLLDEDEIESLMHRRDYALAYIDELIALHGEDEILVFP